MESQADGQSLKYTLLRAVYKKRKEKKSTVLLTLSADVGILLHVAIHKVGIDVVWCGISISQRQCDTWVVVTQNVRVAILRQVVTSPATDNKGCYHPDLLHCFLWLKARVVITQTFLTAPCDSRQQGLLSPRPSSSLLIVTRVVITQTFLTAPCDSRQQGLLSPRPSSLLIVTHEWQQGLLSPRPSSLLIVTHCDKGCYHPDLPHCSLWLKTTRVVITQTFLTVHCDSWMTTKVVFTQIFSLLLVTQDNKGCYHPDLPHCSLWLKTTWVVTS